MILSNAAKRMLVLISTSHGHYLHYVQTFDEKRKMGEYYDDIVKRGEENVSTNIHFSRSLLTLCPDL